MMKPLHELLIDARNRLAWRWTAGAIYDDGAVCAVGGLYVSAYGEKRTAQLNGEDPGGTTEDAMTALEADYPEIGRTFNCILSGENAVDVSPSNPSLAHLVSYNDTSNKERVLEVFDKAIEATAKT